MICSNPRENLHLDNLQKVGQYFYHTDKKIKDTIKAAKTHPEAVAVPVGLAAGSAVEGGKGTIVATVGLAKNVLTTTLNVIKFVSKPVTKLIPIEIEKQ